MDNSSQWPQGFGVVKALDHPSSSGSIDQQQKRTLARPQKDQVVNCPRCNSVNTKFCYYNNYSLSQPRYFCKTCRRYWTAGGSLRNVPVGGGSRKNRRSSSAATSSSSVVLTAAAAQAQAQAVANNLSSASSVLLHQGHDLNLSFPPHPTTHDDLHRHHQQYPNPNLTFSTTKPANFSIDQLSNSKLLSHHILPNTNNSTNMTPLLPPMGLFKNSLAGNNESREMMSSFMNPSISSSASIFSSSGFPPPTGHHQDQFKPSSLNFSLDGFSGGDDDGGYASSLQLGVQQNIDGSASGGARLLFPFNQENVNKLEQVPNDAAAASTSSHVDQFDHHHPHINRSSSSSVQGGGGDGSISAGFWTGMLSGGSW